MRTRARFLWSVALVLSACASTPRPGLRSRPVAVRAPERVDGANVSIHQRTLDENAPAPADAGYRGLRDAVASHLAGRALEAANTGGFDRALGLLRAALQSYGADELQGEVLPEAFAPVARAFVRHYSERGDEARTLVGARILLALRRPDPEGRTTWDRVTEWGTRNRTDFRRPWVREGELAEVFVEVARTVPARDVLDRAAQHLAAWRRAAGEARAQGGPGDRMNYDEARWLRLAAQRPVLDTAMLFLRTGDVREAANRVRALGTAAELADDLGALAAGEGGSGPLGALAERFERNDVTVTAGLCRLGRRTFPEDLRFARCLAAAAARDEDYGLASAHLESAVRLGARDQTLLRAAIEAATVWLRREVGADDPVAGRAAYARAQALLEQWSTRYAGQDPPVAAGDLENIAAELEFAAGSLPEAREHLRRATQARPASREAFLALAEVAWRKGEHPEARRVLAEGLALPLRPTESDSLFRPLFNLRLALVAREAGQADEARQLLTQLSTSLEALGRSTQGEQLARVALQRALVADELGDSATARVQLRASLDAAPDEQDVAARAVTFALTRGWWTEARDLSQRARAQLSLDRNWQVYFALWGVISARLGGLEDRGARAALEAIARAADDHAGWTARLAQRFAGTLDRAALLGHARTAGQRCEAHFYEAMLRRLEGDTASALDDLRASVATDVLRYFEYDLAWEALRRNAMAAPAATATAAPR